MLCSVSNRTVRRVSQKDSSVWCFNLLSFTVSVIFQSADLRWEKKCLYETENLGDTDRRQYLGESFTKHRYLYFDFCNTYLNLQSVCMEKYSMQTFLQSKTWPDGLSNHGTQRVAEQSSGQERETTWYLCEQPYSQSPQSYRLTSLWNRCNELLLSYSQDLNCVQNNYKWQAGKANNENTLFLCIFWILKWPKCY